MILQLKVVLTCLHIFDAAKSYVQRQYHADLHGCPFKCGPHSDPTLHLQNLASLVKKCRKQNVECV